MKNFNAHDDYYAPEEGSPAMKSHGTQSGDQFSNFVAFDETNQLESFLDEEETSSLKHGSYRKKEYNCFDGLKKKFSGKKWVGGAQTIVLIVFLVLASAASMATLVFTFMQIANREKTKMSELVVTDAKTKPCEAVQYHPLRFRILPDTEYIQCSWNTKNNLHRIIWSLVGIFFPLLGILALKKNKKWLMWIFGIMSLALAGVFFFVMAIDADGVRKSKSWCDGGIQGIQLTPADSKIQCGYLPFISTCLADFFAVLFWVIVFIISIRHALKNMDKKSSMFAESL